MAAFDAVFVGSGINSLAGAALLAKAGWRCCVLERNDWLGGAIRTVDGLIAPGFTHEVFASWHPLWTGSPAYAELKPTSTGSASSTSTRTSRPGRRSRTARASSSPRTALRTRPSCGEAWQRQFDEFMGNADLAFGVLGTELWSGSGLGLGRKAYSQLGRRGLVEFSGRALATARDWLTETFDDERAHGLLAPWVLHTGLGPDQAMSGFMTQVIACALQLGGMPVPKGGGVALVGALAAIVRDAGGDLRTEATVERILVAEGRATGVRLTGGETVRAERAVLACVTPTQLYGALLADGEVPPRVRGRRASLPLRPRRDADPRRDERAATLARRRAARAHADRARHAWARRCLPRRERVRAWAAAGGGDDRLRPAARRRPLSGARGLVDRLDPAAGAAARPAWRCGGGARRVGGTGRTSCARPMPTASSSGSAATSRTSRRPRSGASSSRPPTSRRRTRTGSAETSTAARARSTRTSSGVRHPRPRGTRRRSDHLFHIGASTHPGPGLGAGSGYLVAKRLTKPALPKRLLGRLSRTVA